MSRKSELIVEDLPLPPPDFCQLAEPIYIGKDDVLTNPTAEQILRHNLSGERLCGW